VPYTGTWEESLRDPTFQMGAYIEAFDVPSENVRIRPRKIPWYVTRAPSFSRR
jgi:hypothetical protein